MSVRPTDSSTVLSDVLRRIEARRGDPRAPVVVFDLDATLYDNRPRTLAILAEYRATVAPLEPALAAALEGLDVDDVHYLLADTLRGCGVTHPPDVAALSSFWRQRFFVDDTIRHDVPLAGAVEFVRACHGAGAIVVYLTGRDVPAMFLGTVASLRDAGFPIGVAGVELVLKPDALMPDEAFKRGAIPTLGRLGEMVAFFDNEPANCNVALELHPDAAVVLLDTQRVPHAPDPSPGVSVVLDFIVR